MQMTGDDPRLGDIDVYLDELERSEDITVVAAWVMGSYARGVASGESDIDIKFVFIQPVTHYASLTKERSSIESSGDSLAENIPKDEHLETELEFHGWNAKRFLELLGGRQDGNNPSAIESLCSPLEVRSNSTIDDLHEYVNERFNVIEMYMHYRGLAKRNWRKYIEDDSEPTVKRMLYILRGVLYARYIRDTHTLATLDIPTFVETAPESIFEGISRDDMRELVKQKKSGNGDVRIGRDTFEAAINGFLTEELDHRSHVREEHMNSADLDEFMFDIINDWQ